MDRVAASVLLCIGAVIAAPPDSSVTFVQVRPLALTAQNVSQMNPVGRESKIEKLTLVIPRGDTSENNAKRDEITERQEAETTTVTIDVTTQRISAARTFTKSSSRAMSKANYCIKAKHPSGVSTNLIGNEEKNTKRKYKSRCRCEKIWNCPKLQITVPRCPEEYFLCCF